MEHIIKDICKKCNTLRETCDCEMNDMINTKVLEVLEEIERAGVENTDNWTFESYHLNIGIKIQELKQYYAN